MDELINTFKEEFEGANDELNKKRYKNSAILFSKAMFALCDHIIFTKLNRMPKNHAERFRILEEYFKEVYEIVDNIFGKYQDTYTKSIEKKTCEELKNAIKKISGTEEVSDEIKKIIG